METILLATDGSPSALAATWKALELAERLHARLVVASVDMRAPYTAMYAPSDVPEGLQELEHDRVAQVLRDVEALAAARGIRCVTAQLLGPVAEELCAEAERDGASMIVVGSHGWGAVGRALHGSVSTEIVHRAPCPVLVVRSTTPQPDVAGAAARADSVATG